MIVQSFKIVFKINATVWVISWNYQLLFFIRYGDDLQKAATTVKTGTQEMLTLLEHNETDPVLAIDLSEGAIEWVKEKKSLYIIITIKCQNDKVVEVISLHNVLICICEQCKSWFCLRLKILSRVIAIWFLLDVIFHANKRWKVTC